MGEVLRWTPLRHQMLAEIAAGTEDEGLFKAEGATASKVRYDRYDLDVSMALTGPERRAVHQISDAGLLRVVRRESESMYARQHLGLSATGVELLAEWDTEHPEVAGG